MRESERERRSEHRIAQFDADHQAALAHLHDHTRATRANRRDAIAELARARVDVIEETRRGDNVEHHRRGDTTQFRAAVRREVKERFIGKMRVNVRAIHRRADRINRGGESFAQHHKIGNDVPFGERPQSAGATETGLHFVENHLRAKLVAQGADARVEIAGRNQDTAGDRNRFKDHCGGCFVDHVFERGKIAERHGLKTGDQRTELVFELVRRRGERKAGMTMIAFGRVDHTRSSGVRAREFDRDVNRFAAAGRERRVANIARHKVRQFFRQPRAPLAEQEMVANVEIVERVFQRINNRLGTMTQVEHAAARPTIDERVSVTIINAHALAFAGNERQTDHLEKIRFAGRDIGFVIAQNFIRGKWCGQEILLLTVFVIRLQ